jgi:hypothetical protein
MFLRPPPAENGGQSVARAPGVPDEATGLLRPAPPAPSAATGPAAGPPPAAGQVDCPRCGYRNEAARFRCERCAMELRNVLPVAMVRPPPAQLVTGPRRRRAWIAVVVAIAVVVLLAVALFLVVRAVRGRDDAAPAAVGPSAAAPPAVAGLTPVAPATVRASASSTNRDSRFRVAYLLDGDPRSMWQSDGDRLTTNVGVTLTYRFAEPLVLARITMVNGAAIDAQAFRDNERVARLLVRTDSETITWDLPDSPDPQSLPVPPGPPTAAVTFVVQRVYKGAKFPDLAVTDVSFDRLP